MDIHYIGIVKIVWGWQIIPVILWKNDGTFPVTITNICFHTCMFVLLYNKYANYFGTVNIY